MGRPKTWTEEEERFLADNYPSRGALFCAQSLNKTEGSISSKAKALGIKRIKCSHEEFENKLFEREIDCFPIERYTNDRTKLTFECIEGHIWKARPSSVLRGHGCPKCANFSFSLTKPAIFYYIKIIRDSDIFYKVGITNQTLKRRFSKEGDKKIVPLMVKEFDSGQEAKDFEKEILDRFKDERLLNCNILNGRGNTEVFKRDILNKDVDIVV